MNWDKMNSAIRKIIQKAYKSTEPLSKINNENIKKFAEDIVKALS